MDRMDLSTLIELNPGLLEQLAAANPPEQVTAWWATLDETQQTSLVHGASSLVGALGGISPLARGAANRTNAPRELPALDEQITALQATLAVGRELDLDMPAQQQELDALILERAYLERAVAGTVQLTT